MKEIQLTQGKVALVDDEDFDRVSKFKWHAKEGQRTWYAQKNLPAINGKRGMITLHQFLLGTRKGIDHKDGNGLNNRKKNLRLATPIQNCQNRRKLLGCTSRFKGVNWNPKYSHWQARIKVSGKSRSLGCYPSEQEAAQAYDAAAKVLFGRFAWLNFL